MEGQDPGAQLLGHLVPPAIKEIPAFSAASRKYQDKGVQFVGHQHRHPTNVRDFQLEHRVSYPLLLAEPSVVQLTEGLGNAARGLPFTVIVDKTGVISRVKTGTLSEADLDTTLAGLTRPVTPPGRPWWTICA